MSNNNDKVMTPSHIVDEVLAHYSPLIGMDEIILEPFRGEGAFYDKLIKSYDINNVDWCEIDDGEDFLHYERRVDWIITNPPYSIFNDVFPKMLDIADHIILVIPVNKLFSSIPRLMEIRKRGRAISSIHYLGSGRQVGFPFGFPVGAVYITPPYIQDRGIEITYSPTLDE